MHETRSYKDALFGLQEMRENIETVECGGWSKDSEATLERGVVSGHVPLPEIPPHVPGRSNSEPLGDASTGVGVRGEFEFPDSAYGYTSACDVNGVGNTDFEVIDITLQRHGIPGLRWEWDGNLDSDVQFVPNDPGVFQVNWGGNKYNAHETWCVLDDGGKTATPRICKKLKDTLLRMAEAFRNPNRPNPDEYCKYPEPGSSLNPDSLPVVGYPTLIPKKLCFDPENTLECRGTSGAKPEPVYSEDPNTSSNTTCRSPWYPNIENEMFECHAEERLDSLGNRYLQIIIDISGYHYALSTSFYRHYGGAFGDWQETKDPSRSILEVRTPVSEPQLWKLRSECYQYYANPVTHEEEDPKKFVLGRFWEQCEVVILSDSEEDPKKPEWEDKESEDPEEKKRSGKQKDTVKADADAVRDPIRLRRNVPDPWAEDPESNLSIVNASRLKHLQRSLDDPLDITGIMSTILPTKMQASKMVPRHARTDTVSDDGERAFGEFWEAQQMELQKMVADPATRLIMPARFLLGLADDDPVYQYVKKIASRSNGTVAMTLRSGPEDILNVLTSFQRAYVAPIQRVPIPVLVPLASENELTSLIFEWKQWQEEENRFASVRPGRGSNAALATPIIAKLEGYLASIHQARRLRAVEAKFLANIFDLQGEVRRYAADWYLDNSRRLEQAALRGVQRRQLRDIWRQIQATLLKTDESQLHWCSNHRYSLAVYSLLDLPEVWWGDGPPYSLRDPLFAPPDLRDLDYEQPEDTEYDFSDMKFSRESLMIPELVFIEAELKLPSPPIPGAKPIEDSKVPALPAMPGIDIFDSISVPDVGDLPPPDLIEVPPAPPDLSEAITIMENFHSRMQKMYEAYARFQPSFTDLPDPEQQEGNTTKIIHAENDLKERIARAFARWLPERKVDYAGRALRLEEDGFEQTAGKCFEGVVCYFLPPEKQKLLTWQWFVPESGGAELTTKSDQLRDMTVPPEDATEDENPYNTTVPVLRRLFPSFNLPLLINLQARTSPTP